MNDYLNNHDNKTEVSVIMIHYNTRELTENAINTLKKYTTDVNYEIIVIDNASPDGSGKIIAEEFGDDIIYIQAEENLGTSKAFNRALAKSCGEYVLWLNTDVIFTENFIKKLYDFMEENPDCGVCGGNLTDDNGKPTHSFKRKILDVKSFVKDNNTLRRYALKPFAKFIKDGYNHTGKVIKASCIIGADMFVRRDVFDKIGALDEDIFMYAEETEFQYRVITRTQYSICSVPYAKLIHLGGKSISPESFSEKREKLALTGTCIYLAKSFGTIAAIKFLKNSIKWYKINVLLARLSFNTAKKKNNKAKIGIATELLETYNKI